MALKFRRGTTAQQSGSLAFGEPYVNTTLGTLLVGGASSDIQLSPGGASANIVALSVSASSFISGSSLKITGNAAIDGNLTLGGNITIGDNTSDNLVVNADLSSSIIPNDDNAFDLGSSSKKYKTIYGTSLEATNITASAQIVNGDLKISSASPRIYLIDTDNNDDFSIGNTDGTFTITDDSTTTDKFKIYSPSGLTEINGATSIINGGLIAAGGVTGSIAATNGVVSGSSQINYTSISSIPAGIVSGSVQVDITSTTGYTAFSGAIATTDLAQTNRLNNLELASASVLGHIADINTKTGSFETKFSTLSTYTASVNGHITDINTKTGSFETKFSTLSTYTASVDGHISDINTKTGSFETKHSTLATYTASVNGHISDINSYTSSLRAAITASGTNVIFTNDVTIPGNLTVRGTQTTVDSTTVTIGDSVIELNYGGSAVKSGILSKDGTGGSTVSGSLLWDGTLDTWVAGISGSEAKVITDAHTPVTSSQQVVGILSSLNSFSASQESKDTTISSYTSSMNTFTASVNGHIADINSKTGSYALNTVSNLFNGDQTFSGSLIPATSGAYDLGSTSKPFRHIYVGTGSIYFVNPEGSTSYTISADTIVTTDVLDSGSIDLTKSLPAGTVSSSAQVVGILSSVNTYTASLDTKNATLATTTASLQLATASFESKHLTIATYTSSVDGHIADINTKTGSFETKFSTISTVTASFNGHISDINVKTGSFETKHSTIATYTSSVNGHIADINTKTGSFETKNATLATYTASLETKNATLSTVTASFNGHIADINTKTGSFETKHSTLATYTASLETKNATLSTVTASLLSTQTNLNSYTSSLNTAIQLTGSTVSFLGNIVVYGTQSIINSQNVQISDNILYLSPTASTDNDLGIVGHYNDGTYRHAGIFMDASDGHSWKVFNNLTDETIGTVDTAGTGFTLAPFKAGAITGTSFSGQILSTNGVVSGSSQIDVASTTGDIALGTRTSGNYVASLVAGTNITLANNSGEGATPTIGLTNNAITIAGTSTSLGGTITAEQIRTAIGTVVTSSAQIDHNSTTNYSANRHIDHTAVSISAGSGLTGGGDISTTRTLSIATGGVTNDMLAGSIANAKLANSAITIAGTSTSLGGAITAEQIRTAIGTVVTGSSQISLGSASGNIALSTQTTGDYVASLVAGTGVTLSNNSGEGATPTVAIGQSVATNATPTFGNLTINGTITATGDITAYYTSDIRHKNNIQTIPNALDKVKQLNGVTWEWNDDVNEVTKSTPKTGLIAQEVQSVLPQVVVERENGFLGLDYSKMIGLLVEAIKEQQTQIDELKAQLGSK